MALVVFAVTLFVSAFILFLVQPIIGKLILPMLGGTPQVWNTCMVFFQMVLLAGYAYTHTVSTKVKLRTQLIIHGILLLAPLYFLFAMGSKPFDLQSWLPPLGSNPLFSTLSILTVFVGIPFFVVSTSAPLLQKWFVYTGHHAAKDPYFLYAASNVGSLLALLLYPVAVEPFMRLTPQTWLWAFSYVALLGFVAVCIAMVWKPAGHAKFALADHHEPGAEPAAAPGNPQPNTGVSAAPSAASSTAAKSTAFKKGGRPTGKFTAPRKEAAVEIGGIQAADEVTTWRRLRWIGLAAVPSSLMLGVTTHITTDLSPIPLFWLIPLSLYLLSFILVFSRWPVPWVGTPHTYMLYTQPVFIALLVFGDIFGANAADLWTPITLNLFGFFSTALVCHGELAKDRPGTRHLTEFYLMMSVGGMLGGMFNGLFAPIVFPQVWEFPIAVMCACLLRPKLREGGWSDELVGGILEPQTAAAAPAHKGAKGPQRHHGATAAPVSETTSTAMDYILPAANALLLVLLVFVLEGMMTSLSVAIGGKSDKAVAGMRLFLTFGVVLVISCFYYGRPMRYGLTVAAVLIIYGFYSSRHENTLYSDRSYFGVIKIRYSFARENGKLPYSTLIHGHIDHGMNLFKPEDRKDWGDSEKDYSRLATTYYHRLGPAGVVMEKFNWWGHFSGPRAPDISSLKALNTYEADARMPVSQVGAVVASLGASNLPLGSLVDLWSEPPYAIIGLGTGTMASYSRPYQHVHYYEIDNHIRRLSLPVDTGKTYFTWENFTPGNPNEIPMDPFTFDVYRPGSGSRPKTFFTYLKDATKRGSEVEVLMGDARLRMALPYKNFHAPLAPGEVPGGGPDNFYHMMVVDAFTSDAIPAHLLTKESFEMYFKKLTQDGILCVHTSNRYVDLPKVVADIAVSLDLEYKRGHDSPTKEILAKQIGHTTSEWVMVARRAPLGTDSYLKDLYVPDGYQTEGNESYWSIPSASGGRYLWTDDYYNLWSILRGR
ncbi:MAG: hypothetical protein HY040_20715 [Planctomycetes bacterium]|nr:hypothetical protein [Planctomycetota bacterium]